MGIGSRFTLFSALFLIFCTPKSLGSEPLLFRCLPFIIIITDQMLFFVVERGFFCVLLFVESSIYRKCISAVDWCEKSIVYQGYIEYYFISPSASVSPFSNHKYFLRLDVYRYIYISCVQGSMGNPIFLFSSIKGNPPPPNSLIVEALWTQLCFMHFMPFLELTLNCCCCCSCCCGRTNPRSCNWRFLVK